MFNRQNRIKDQLKRNYQNGLLRGLEEAEKIADWLKGQDHKQAMKHIERMRKELMK